SPSPVQKFKSGGGGGGGKKEKKIGAGGSVRITSSRSQTLLPDLTFSPRKREEKEKSGSEKSDRSERVSFRGGGGGGGEGSGAVESATPTKVLPPDEPFIFIPSATQSPRLEGDFQSPKSRLALAIKRVK